LGSAAEMVETSNLKLFKVLVMGLVMNLTYLYLFRNMLLQNITQLTGGGRTIFLIVMGFNWSRQEKGLPQFQQLILIPMTKKKKI
jgi:hypothetical protein